MKPHLVSGSAADDTPGAGVAEAMPNAVISLLIMELLAGAEAALGVSDLARMLDMPKARVHRHLSGLREHGYVVQTGRNNRYTTGWRLHLLGQQLVRKFDIMATARPLMEDLRDQVGQTVVISTFTDSEVVVIDVVPGRCLLEIGLRPGTRFALNTVAQGKIALAFGPEELGQQLFAAPLSASTSHTITDADRLRAEIGLTRLRGWADAPEEIFSGINAIAAPIFRNDGTLFGALAMVGSIDFIPKVPDPEILAKLQESARLISVGLGHGAGVPHQPR